MPTDRALAAAARDLLDVWDGWTVYDLAIRLTQSELVAFVDLLVVANRSGDARSMMERWIESEIEDRECNEGDWIITEDDSGRPELTWTREEM